MNAEVDEQNTSNEEAKMEEQVVEKIDEELTCPIDQMPWNESACAVIERRVVKQVLKRLKAEQASEEVVAPAAEIEEDDPTAAENS